MGTTERLVVDLPSDLVERLRDSIKSGAFASESEAIAAVLRPWYGHERVEEPDLATLRAFVVEGIAAADAGRGSNAEDGYARLIEAIAASKSK